MAYEMREGDGSLFKNENRSSEKAPNMTGKALVDGRMYRISAWTKEDKNGNRYQSLKIEPADGTRRNDQPMAEQLSDSIPF